jgi:hypothetical protein
MDLMIKSLAKEIKEDNRLFIKAVQLHETRVYGMVQ